MILNLLIAGFGGQGVLFMGKVAAETAMLTGKGSLLAAQLRP